MVAAEAVREALALLRSAIAEDDHPLELDTVVSTYLAQLATYASPEHLRATRRQLRAIAGVITTAHPIEVLGYRQKRLAAGASNRTANMEVGALRACLNWAVRIGIIREHLVGRIQSLPQRESDQVRRARALNDLEIERFLLESRRMDLRRRVPQTVLWWLLIEIGLRWGDAIALRCENVKGTRLTISADTTKGRRTREVPLPPRLAAELPAMLPFRSPKGVQWTGKNERNARRMFHLTAARAGVAPSDAAGRTIFIHALRKTAATRMLRRGVPLPVVSAILGHRDPALTARLYVQVDVEDMEREMTTKVWGS